MLCQRWSIRLAEQLLGNFIACSNEAVRTTRTQLTAVAQRWPDRFPSFGASVSFVSLLPVLLGVSGAFRASDVSRC